MFDALTKLFIQFFQIGLFSIGGGYATIPLIQERVVKIQEWLSFQEFTDIITISQMTPGPLAVNTSTFVGIQIAGIPGALVATIGCTISGITIALILYRLFDKFKNNAAIAFVLRGLRAVSIGLIAASASTILLIAFCGTMELPSLSAIIGGKVTFNLIAAGIFAVSFFILRKWKLNPMLVMVLSGVAGVFLY